MTDPPPRTRRRGNFVRKKKSQLPTHYSTYFSPFVSRHSGWRPVLIPFPPPPALRRLLADPDPLGDLHYRPSGLGSYIYCARWSRRLDTPRRTGRDSISNLSTPAYSRRLPSRSDRTGGEGMDAQSWALVDGMLYLPMRLGSVTMPSLSR